MDYNRSVKKTPISQQQIIVESRQELSTEESKAKDIFKKVRASMSIDNADSSLSDVLQEHENSQKIFSLHHAASSFDKN